MYNYKEAQWISGALQNKLMAFSAVKQFVDDFSKYMDEKRKVNESTVKGLEIHKYWLDELNLFPKKHHKLSRKQKKAYIKKYGRPAYKKMISSKIIFSTI